MSQFFSETKGKLKISKIITELEIDSGKTIEFRTLRLPNMKMEPAGEADFTCLINGTPRDTVKKILVEKNMIGKTSKITLDNSWRTDENDLDDYLKEYDFYNATLNLSVMLHDPTHQSLIYERFSMYLGPEDIKPPVAQILKIAPDKNGILTKVKETGGRKFNVSPTLEVGASFEQSQTGKTSVSDTTQSSTTTTGSESSRKVNLGPKIGVTGSWSKEKGYEITYDNLVENVTGAILQDNRKVMWEVTQAKLKEPDGNLVGKLISVPAFLIFMVKKRKENGNLVSQKINAKIDATGKAKENVSLWFDTMKEIVFVGKRVRELEPVLKGKPKSASIRNRES